jgi:hypothetical protein
MNRFKKYLRNSDIHLTGKDLQVVLCFGKLRCPLKRLNIKIYSTALLSQSGRGHTEVVGIKRVAVGTDELFVESVVRLLIILFEIEREPVPVCKKR